MPGTVTRADLAEAVFRKTGLARGESSDMVDTIIEEICSALARGENVKLSSFAVFTVRSKAAREGRNPRTGEAAHISPRRVISFRVSSELKRKVSSGHKERKPKAASR